MTQQLHQHAAANAPAFLPLFYKDPVLLRFDMRRQSDGRRSNLFDFALEATAVPLGVGEFMPAIRHYPVVFSESGPAVPLAVLGLQQGGKLLVDHKGAWQTGRGHYQPGYVRRYPFAANDAPGHSASLRAVAEEPDAGFLSGDCMAEPSDMDVCQAFHEDHLRTAAFAEAMDEAGLLIAHRCDLKFPAGVHYTLDGFRVIDESAFRALPITTLAGWHGKGWLDLITLHLASQRNWQLLLDLHAFRHNNSN
jgi:hypothetical protein